MGVVSRIKSQQFCKPCENHVPLTAADTLVLKEQQLASTGSKDRALLSVLIRVFIYWQWNKNELLGQPNYRRNWWLSNFLLMGHIYTFLVGKPVFESPGSPFCLCHDDQGWISLSSWIKYMMESPWKAPSCGTTVGEVSFTQRALYDREVMFTFKQCQQLLKLLGIFVKLVFYTPCEMD